MPEPATDFKLPSVAIEPPEPQVSILSPQQREDRCNGAEISLAQFATQISEVLTRSGIGVHSSFLMELLGTSATADPETPATSSGEIGEAQILETTPPVVSTSVSADRAPVSSDDRHKTMQPETPAAIPQNSQVVPASIQPGSSQASPSPHDNRSNGAPPPLLPMTTVVERALSALSMLKLKVSSVISVARAEDGWRVAVELVERAGVPDTSDVLGIYELRLDSAANVLAYERTRMRRRCDLGR